MKIYDCFLFSSELELLTLRLSYLDDQVDYFVLVESERTLSRTKKPLYYFQNKHLFEKFNHKIIHVVAENNDMAAWDYEFFQRNAIKNGLKACSSNDLVFISDVDEIVNVKEVTKHPIMAPMLVQLSMYYYYINLRVGTKWLYNLVAPYQLIEKIDIGDRNNYKSVAQSNLLSESSLYGWHFSYLFGHKLSQYQDKIRSFSHQEFNTPYHLNLDRIDTCIAFGIDLFERPYEFNIDENPYEKLKAYLTGDQLSQLVYHKRTIGQLRFIHLYWLLRMKVVNRVVNSFRNRFLK